MQRDGGPGGPGTGGNPTGGSFTGPAEALEIIGDHAYGYSGVIGITTTESNLLSFKTGNFYFVGTVQFMYASSANDPFKYRIYLNEAVIAQYGVSMSGDYSQNETGPEQDIVRLIIPPYTEVKMTAENDGSGTTDQCVACQGRIYRG